MKPSELKTLLTEMIKSESKITPFVWGQHGIGKSSIKYQVAKEMGYNILTLTLSQREATDLAGLPYVFEDTYTGEKVTCNYTPDWFNMALKKGKLILFLDEFNMARREVMGAAFELVLSHRLNNIELPDSVFIVAAGNPEDDRYPCTPMSDSLLDRFMHIHLQPDVNEWLTWARKSGVHSDIVDFIQVSPQSLFIKDARDSKFPVAIKHSGRSWADRASEIWGMNLSMEIKQECLMGIVGTENTAAFIKNLEENQDRPLDAKKALSDIKNTENKFIKWKNSRADLISVTLENVLEFISTSTEFEKENLLNFVLLLPEDLIIKFFLKYTQNAGNDFGFFIKDKNIAKIIENYYEVKKNAEKESKK